MTATVSTPESVPESPQPVDPLAKQRWSLRIFALLASIVIPVGVMALLDKVILPGPAAALSELQVYQLAVPMCAATVVLAIFGVLFWLLQRTWALVGAVVAAALVTVSYLAPATQLGLPRLGFVGVAFIAVPLLLLATLPSMFQAVRTLPAVELLKPSTIYKVGTLRYTLFGLIMIFIWLLWGDFAQTLFNDSISSVMVLKLKEMGASDTVNGFLNKVIAYAVYFFIAPAVSFRSDRHRGPRGRRIPYLLWATPFVGLFMVLMGCNADLTRLMTGGASTIHIMGIEFSQVGVALLVFGILFVAFDLANIFAGTLFWYLFNDVVPAHKLSLFLSFFRVVGGLGGILYSEFLFAHSLTHFKLMFVVGGIAYVAGFMLMCFMVKEGKYPPPPPLVAKPTGDVERFFRRMTARAFEQPGFAMLGALVIPWLCIAALNLGVLGDPLVRGLAAREIGRITFWLAIATIVYAQMGTLAWLFGKLWLTILMVLAGLGVTAVYFHFMHNQPLNATACIFSLPVIMVLIGPLMWLKNRYLSGVKASNDPAAVSWTMRHTLVAPVAVGKWVDNFVAQAHTYAKECFTHKFYWLFFLQSMFFFVSWQAGIFSSLRNINSLKISMQDLGNLGAITGLVSLFLQVPSGWLADKWNPIRVFFFTTFVTFGQNVAQCVFIFTDYKPATNLLIMTWFAFTVMPFSLLHGAAELPMYMRLLPKDRYGQFCSANAMFRAFCMIFGSLAASYLMQSLDTWFHMGDFRYRFYPVWAVIFQIPALFCLWLLYREWLKRGGDKGYTPPAT